MAGDVVTRYREVLDKLRFVCVASGRTADEVRLVAVSKHADIEDVQALYDIGVRDFGESRAPELLRKSAALPRDIIWHFIGPIQANKVRKIVSCADMIHSAASTEIIERIDRICGEEKRHPKILIEVNVSGEESKGGFRPAEVAEAVKLALSCRNLELVGLMCMAPLEADHEQLMNIFGALRALEADLEKRFDCQLPELSMGMSGDFPEAIASGATMVRIGTAIFGK